jgi:hypothetical protein
MNFKILTVARKGTALERRTFRRFCGMVPHIRRLSSVSRAKLNVTETAKVVYPQPSCIML